MRKFSLILLTCFIFFISCMAQPLSTGQKLTKQDTLRGTYGPERSWWDVQKYEVEVKPDYANRSIEGFATIYFKILPERHSGYMQIDLQEPMVIDSIYYNNKPYISHPSQPVYREGNVYHIPMPRHEANSIQSISFKFHGKPHAAVNPPWDGGWIFKKDSKGRPWMSVACQGLGASVWFPCKDHQSDEPDLGAVLSIWVPDSLNAVGNGRKVSIESQRQQTWFSQNNYVNYTWEVKNPINSYNIIPYIGKYVSWKDTLEGEKGKLDITYWVLDYELEKAKKQFAQVKPTLRAFEYWFGPYPFYEDGFQLVQAPHLGMEHQSAVAYGNQFKNGYLGTDLSGTGWGLKWDFIIVHETGHEWFGNNITSRDIADMWVHEGFTNYSEALFTEYYYGKEAGEAYVQGLRSKIQNDIPLIGPYGVNREGSGDMYYKGSNLVHTLRQLIDDDEKFRTILRGLNKEFYHQTVTSKMVEDYFISQSGKDLQKIFDQYLRTTDIPVLELKADGESLKFKWTNSLRGFNMPVKLTNGQWIHPTTSEQKIKIKGKNFKGLTVDKNFYIQVKKG